MEAGCYIEAADATLGVVNGIPYYMSHHMDDTLATHLHACHLASCE